MPDTIDFRFVNSWVETGGLPCREAWRRALAAEVATAETHRRRRCRRLARSFPIELRAGGAGGTAASIGSG